jgi:hypothetical protein
MGAAPDGLARIMATRPGFARPFTGAVVTDLRDESQAASSASMAAIAPATSPGFGQARVGSSRWPTRSRPSSHRRRRHGGWKWPGLASIQTASIEAGWHRPSRG